MKRFLFVILSLASTTFLGVLFVSSSANAFSSDIGTCSDQPPALDFVKQDSRYSAQKTEFALFEREWTGPPFYGRPALLVVWDNTVAPSTSVFVESPHSNGNFGLFIDGPGNTYYYNNTWVSVDNYSQGQGAGFYDATCLGVQQNVPVPPNFTWPGGGVDPEPPVKCDIWDVPCWFSKTIENIVTGFQDMFRGIGELFTDFADFMRNLFVPDEETGESTVSSLVDGFKSSMDSKLGMLTYPFKFATDVFSPLLTLSNSDNKQPWTCNAPGAWQPGVCSISFSFFGAPAEIDIGAFERYYKQAFDILIIFVRIAFAFAIAEMFRRAYYEVTAK